jgi:hypothetical protein
LEVVLRLVEGIVVSHEGVEVVGIGSSARHKVS